MVADERVWQEATWRIEQSQVQQSVMDIEDWFEFAWNREVPCPKNPPNKGERQLNLGAGYREVTWAKSLGHEQKFDLEDQVAWNHVVDDETVDAIWAHGVFEHIVDIPALLRQCERVLRPGGVLNIVVPHGLSDLYVEDIDHKHPIVEDTWRNIMDNPYYQAGGQKPWKLKMHTQFIMGVVWRNLALFTQFVKSGS